MSDMPDAPFLDPETAARVERENTTVGQYERLAGIGQTHEERLAFRLQFQHPDGQECIRLAMNECRRRIGLPKRAPDRTLSASLIDLTFRLSRKASFLLERRLFSWCVTSQSDWNRPDTAVPLPRRRFQKLPYIASCLASGVDGNMMSYSAILLLFASIGPLIGGLSHTLLMTLFEPSGFSKGGLPLLVSLVAPSYAIGLVPALVVGAAVAWRSRHGSFATFSFALVVASVVPVTLVTLVIVALRIGSGAPLLDDDPVWRERQLGDVAMVVSLSTLHSIVATIGCWLLARHRRLACDRTLG